MKKTPYAAFFEHAASRVEKANAHLKDAAKSMVSQPEVALRFIMATVQATAFRTVYVQVYDARNLLPKETEEGALRRIKVYAEETLRRHASRGMILSTGLLDQALAAEEIRAWHDVLECLRDATRNEPPEKRL